MNPEKFSPSASLGDSPKPVSLSAGKRLEAQLFKELECGWDGEKWVELAKHNHREAQKVFNDWVNHNSTGKVEAALIDWVKEHQPEGWDPHEPPVIKFVEKKGSAVRDVRSEAPGNLHYFVMEQLGVDDLGELAFYTSAGTPLDTLYGIDGFFEWQGMRVTLDITKNRDKLEYGRAQKKANVIFTLNDVDEDGWFQKIPESDLRLAAMKIADEFKFKQRVRQQAA